MRTQHSIGWGSSSKSLSGGGNQYQEKYTNKQFGKGYKPSEDDEMDRSSEDEDAKLSSTHRRYGNSVFNVQLHLNDCACLTESRLVTQEIIHGRAALTSNLDHGFGAPCTLSMVVD